YLLQKLARVVLQTNNIDHHRTADFPALAAALAGKTGRTASMREVYHAPAILLIGNDPTEQHPLLAWQIRNTVRLHRARLHVVNSKSIKLRRQATLFAPVPETNREVAFIDFLAGNAKPSPEDAAQLQDLRDKVRAESELVVIFGSELRGRAISTLVNSLPQAKFVCLGDYANSRGAADMGLYPDLLPGYLPIDKGSNFAADWGTLPTGSGLNFLQMAESAKVDQLKVLYVVGANPINRFRVDPFAFSNSFVVVQDMFLTETALMADAVLPAANAYEKSGSFTNTCGDLHIVRKAGADSGCQADCDTIMRVTESMGFDVHKLVPFRRGEPADMGQSRGAQSGEADRHAVWLEAHGLEIKMSPFD